MRKPLFLSFLLVSCPTRERGSLRPASQNWDTMEENACLCVENCVENSYIFLLSQLCAETERFCPAHATRTAQRAEQLTVHPLTLLLATDPSSTFRAAPRALNPYRSALCSKESRKKNNELRVPQMLRDGAKVGHNFSLSHCFLIRMSCWLVFSTSYFFTFSGFASFPGPTWETAGTGTFHASLTCGRAS
jgi:hypothetical protein